MYTSTLRVLVSCLLAAVAWCVVLVAKHSSQADVPLVDGLAECNLSNLAQQLLTTAVQQLCSADCSH
jgi:hypothetical protein